MIMRALQSTSVRYVLVGGANTLVGLASIYAAKWLLTMPDAQANLLGYAIGFTLSFTLNRRWTFRFHGAPLPALARFLVVQLVAYFGNLATVLLFITAGGNSYLAQAVGVVPYALIGYLGSRRYAFPAARTTRLPARRALPAIPEHKS